MKSTPLVSVVVPTRERDALLLRAIQSVVAQTYKNIEIIVVDDFSVRPPFFVRDIAQCRLIVNDRRLGAQRSRYIGAADCGGEFIALLDSDDWWVRDKIESQLKVFESSPDALVASRLIAVRGLYRRTAPARTLRDSEPVEDFLYVEGGMLQTSTIIARRNIILNLLELTLETQVHNDTALFLAARNQNIEIKQLEMPLSYFDDNPRPDRVSYDKARVEESVKWFEKHSQTWSRSAKRGYIIVDLVTRYVNSGLRARAFALLLCNVDLGRGSLRWLKKLLYVTCGGSPRHTINAALAIFKPKSS